MTNKYGVRMRVRMRSRAYAGAVQVEVKPRRRAIPYHFHIARANGCVSALTKNWEHRLIWRTLHDSGGHLCRTWCGRTSYSTGANMY